MLSLLCKEMLKNKHETWKRNWVEDKYIQTITRNNPGGETHSEVVP